MHFITIVFVYMYTQASSDMFLSSIELFVLRGTLLCPHLAIELSLFLRGMLL